VQSEIVPPEIAAEELGFDMDKIKKYRDEQAERDAEQMQIGKVNQELTEDQTKIGKIIDHKPSADSMIAKGASVDITIATKKE